MTTWFASRTCTIWQTHTALRVVWATALLVFTATHVMANGGGTVKPIVVDANTTPCLTSYSAHYTTIQAAVNAAPSGATINICPGNYPEQITIGTPLTLKGVTNLSANAGAAVITMPPLANWISNGCQFGVGCPSAVQVLVQAANVNFTDVGVDGTNSVLGCNAITATVGIGYNPGSSGTLNRVAVRNQNEQTGSGGYCGQGSGIASAGASVTVENSSIRGFDSIGFFDEGGTMVVKTSAFSGVGGSSLCVATSTSTAQVNNNTLACTNGVFVGKSTTVSGNTITALGGLGISCPTIFPCTGLNITGNTIAGSSAAGIYLQRQLPSGGNTITCNNISGAGIAIADIFGLNDAITQNTINDAQYGIVGITGNNVSGNTFFNVTTLTQ